MFICKKCGKLQYAWVDGFSPDEIAGVKFRIQKERDGTYTAAIDPQHNKYMQKFSDSHKQKYCRYFSKSATENFSAPVGAKLLNYECPFRCGGIVTEA